MFERNDHLIEGGWVPAAGTELPVALPAGYEPLPA
jgi:hypothetical protein